MFLETSHNNGIDLLSGPAFAVPLRHQAFLCLFYLFIFFCLLEWRGCPLCICDNVHLAHFMVGSSLCNGITSWLPRTTLHDNSNHRGHGSSYWHHTLMEDDAASRHAMRSPYLRLLWYPSATAFTLLWKVRQLPQVLHSYRLQAVCTWITFGSLFLSHNYTWVRLPFSVALQNS